jgi:B12-binding domain/radical SAM domain protein
MNKNYDVILIHPPAFYDFRQRVIFPGVMGETVAGIQFTKPPIGMLSLADYLDRQAYKVIIDNLGDRMVQDGAFDVEEHLTNLSARVYAVGLHFQQHAGGAIEIARLIKRLHPGSPVILGGLTATRFHAEILGEYLFVDGVIRGEAEKPFLRFLRNLERKSGWETVPNLTWRDIGGNLRVNLLGAASANLDEFEFTRLELLEPRTSVFNAQSLPRWSLEVCRGCRHNCAICGGSAYTYRTYLGLERPAFRSPARIIQDILKLNDQGVRIIGLYQDPRMGGRAYWRELLRLLKTEKLDLDRLSLDLLLPASEEFIRAVAEINRPVTLHICPDSGCESVRRQLGRKYSNAELLETIRLCHKYLIPVTSFFSVGLAGESPDHTAETWALCEELFSREQIALTRGREWGLSGPPLGGPILGPIQLDPGSLAFDFPEKYGYQLLYPGLKEYIQALSQPSWHRWINYRTDLLAREQIVELILRSSAFSIAARLEYGLCAPQQAELERRTLKARILALNEVELVMQRAEGQADALNSLSRKVDELLGSNSAKSS